MSERTPRTRWHFATQARSRTMIELIALFGVVVLSMLIIRMGATALRVTGISADVARFQAKSAFSNTGFSTRESELVVNHPLRRRIIGVLITLGSFGVPAMLTALMLTINSVDGDTLTGIKRISALLCVLVCLAIIVRSPWIDDALERLMEWLLTKVTDLEVVDYQSVLEIERGYRVARLPLKPESWLAQGNSLRELSLSQAGVLVIGIHRAGEYIGTPGADVVLLPGDELMLYANQDVIDELASREGGVEGDRRQLEAIKRHSERLEVNSQLLQHASLRLSHSSASQSATSDRWAA